MQFYVKNSTIYTEKRGNKLKVSEFNYELPERLIAQVPIEKRDESRLMILDRKKQEIEHKTFNDIIEYLFKLLFKQLTCHPINSSS